MKSTSFRFSSLLFFFIVAGYSNVAAGDTCLYKIHVKTASDDGAGTDSRIKLTLGDAKGATVQIPDLAQWGVNGPSYDYFESDQLDFFTGRANCILVCSIIVASDNSGYKSGWKLDYVDVVTSGPGITPAAPITFEVDQWLAESEPPYSLSVARDQCYQVRARARAGAANHEVDANESSGPAFDIIRQAWAE